PESFGELQSLCDCWLDKNRLSCLPASIGQLTSLSFFDLSGNRIETLPHELGLCAALCDLNLSANLLRCLPDTVDGLTGLAGLRLDANRLLQLPQSIGRLSALCDLNISSNLLACLPPTIGLLRQLQTLHADCNRLTELPSSIGSCSSLTILSLRANLLRFVPDEIGHLQELRVLNLSANRLDCLPISMLRLPDLQALWLSDNQTEPLPRLQPEDVLAGKAVLRVLTCYLLPQLPVPLATLREEDELDDFNSMERQRTVQFAVDGGESPSDAAEDRHLPKDLPDGRRRVWAACVPTSTERVGLSTALGVQASCLRRCLPCVTSNSSSAESAAHYLPHLPTLGNPDGVTTEVANSPSDDAAKTTTAASRQNPLDLVSPLSTSSPLSGHQAVSNGSDPNNNNNGTSDAYEMVLLQDATPVATIRIRPGDHSHSHLRQHYGYDSDGGLPAARVRSLPATVAPLSRRGSHPGSQLPPIAQSESALTPPLHQPPPPPPPPPRGPHWPTAPSGPAAPIAVPEDSASSDSGYGGRRPAPAPPPARSPPPPPQIHNLPPSSGIRVPPVRTSTASVAVLPDADFRSGGSSSEFSVPVAAAASTLLLWVTIDRGPTLGFSVSGGADTAEGGVFVSRLLPNCPASDLLRFGDRILQVNEMPFGGLSHSEAVQFLKAQGRVRLLIQRSVSSEPLLNCIVHLLCTVVLQLLRPTQEQLPSDDDLRDSIAQRQAKNADYTNKRRRARDSAVEAGDWVWQQVPHRAHKLATRLKEPLKIASQAGRNTFVLSDGTKWHASRLIKCNDPTAHSGAADRADELFEALLLPEPVARAATVPPPPPGEPLPEAALQRSTRARRQPARYPLPEGGRML
uniref:PDZ domain-containing protein n=1 Tax=Macrostomum lignano TaxID=282301 RepID=A0A1I8GGJ8_9PLAT